MTMMNVNNGLRIFSKLTCAATLFLIFAGGMVTSTGSGLAVPDWPLSYGSWFPPMVGGVFYEHGHRMVASFVGVLTLILAIWVGLAEKRKWLRGLAIFALGAVVAQGILGGMTVKFYLPTAVSVFHALLAQTFFIITLIIAYSFSKEREAALNDNNRAGHGRFLKLAAFFSLLIYMQLIIAALMRHTHSGLAIPDFPTMGGEWWPRFDDTMLQRINHWRFMNDLDYVTMPQIFVHFLHRIVALVIVITVCFLNYHGLESFRENKRVIFTLLMIDALIFLQVFLGILTVISMKSPVITSLHVVGGALILGVSVLLVLRVAPLQLTNFKEALLR